MMDINNTLPFIKNSNELRLEKDSSVKKQDTFNEKPFSRFLTKETSKREKEIIEKSSTLLKGLASKKNNFNKDNTPSWQDLKKTIKNINALLGDLQGKTINFNGENKKLVQEIKEFLQYFQQQNEQIENWGDNENVFFNHFLKDLQNFFKQENFLSANPEKIKDFLLHQKNVLKNILLNNSHNTSFNQEPIEKINTFNDLKELWEDAKAIENQENQKKINSVKNESSPYLVVQGKIKSNHKMITKVPIQENKNSFSKISTNNNSIVLESLSSSKKATIAPSSVSSNPAFAVIDVKNLQSNFSSENNFSFFSKGENNSFLDKTSFLNKVNGGQKHDPTLLQSQLVKTIKNGLVEGKEVMTVKLKPEALGEIKIIMKKENDFLHLKLLVDNNNVKEIMEQKLIDLKQHLAEENIDLLSLGIDLQQKSASEEFSSWLTQDEKINSKNSMGSSEPTTENAVIDLRSQKVLNLMI